MTHRRLEDCTNAKHGTQVYSCGASTSSNRSPLFLRRSQNSPFQDARSIERLFFSLSLSPSRYSIDLLKVKNRKD